MDNVYNKVQTQNLDDCKAVWHIIMAEISTIEMNSKETNEQRGSHVGGWSVFTKIS
jgi:hypothetical protein